MTEITGIFFFFTSVLSPAWRKMEINCLVTDRGVPCCGNGQGSVANPAPPEAEEVLSELFLPTFLTQAVLQALLLRPISILTRTKSSSTSSQTQCPPGQDTPPKQQKEQGQVTASCNHSHNSTCDDGKGPSTAYLQTRWHLRSRCAI